MWCHSFPLSEPFVLAISFFGLHSGSLLGPGVILTMREFASRAEKQDALDAHRHAVRCACLTRMRSDQKGIFPS